MLVSSVLFLLDTTFPSTAILVFENRFNTKERWRERERECCKLVLYFCPSLYNEIYEFAKGIGRLNAMIFVIGRKIITQITCSAFNSPCFVHYAEPHNYS